MRAVHALPHARRFGVRISQREIPRLAHILERFSEEEVAAMQRRTACAAQHLHWSTNLGGIMGETGEGTAGGGTKPVEGEGEGEILITGAVVTRVDVAAQLWDRTWYIYARIS